jgi:transcriptional repressor NrdR
MKCPYCSRFETQVIDSRDSDDFSSIRRRRECFNCQKRFTTYEKIEFAPLLVIKKDGSRQTFERQKLENGMLKACEKRPVSIEVIRKAVDDIECDLRNRDSIEIDSKIIGNLVMKKLRAIDKVAYIRFASVYRQFEDVESFEKVVQALK